MSAKIIISITALLLSTVAFGGDAPVSKEDRQKMAEAHLKMADCLKTDKPVSECHNELMESCDMMGKDGCPMMGPMHGKMHDAKKKTPKK